MGSLFQEFCGTDALKRRSGPECAMSFHDGPYTQAALELTTALVGINSFSRNIAGINLVQDRLEQRMLALGLTVVREDVGSGADILIGKTKVESDQRALLIGHSDTVYPENSEFQKADVGVTEMKGPGTVDMKGGLAVILESLGYLNDQGVLHEIPITVMINPDEEIGSPDSRRHFEREVQSAACALVFEGGRIHDRIITTRRGIQIYNLVVTGANAHAGTNHHKGANAILQAAKVVADIEALTDYDKGITANVGVFNGGTAVNVVPSRAEVDFEVRFRDKADGPRLAQQISDIVSRTHVQNTSSELTQTIDFPTMEETEGSRELARRFRECAASIGIEIGDEPFPGPGGSDANHISALGVPTIDGLGPFGGLPHSEDEFLVMPTMGPKMAALSAFLLSLKA